MNSPTGHRSAPALILGLALCASTSTGASAIVEAVPAVWAGGRHTKAPRGIDAVRACARASGQTIGGATLTTAVVPSGRDHPQFCRISGHLAPNLNFELRLPDAWNGKLYYQGVGGYGGYMPDVAGVPLTRGYAEVASDTGHQGDSMSAAFALNDAYAAQQFGSLAVPTVMASVSKILITLYDAPASKSYFEGCSTGGGEALMAVQRNPGLFDGVIARAPGFNWVAMTGAYHRTQTALTARGVTFPAAKVALVAKHVRESCDGLDGIVDGIVSNPAACAKALPDLKSLRCAGGNDTGDDCLSDGQLAVLTSWTSGSSFAQGKYRSGGYNLTGNEDDPDNFPNWVTGNGDYQKSGQFVMLDTAVKFYLARDPNADPIKYSPYDQNESALFAMAALNDATQTDIRTYIRAGGKLIVWQGGSDAALSVNSTIEYMQAMRATVGEQDANRSTRLYVAPGVNHCGGGPGADETDLLAALDQWVSHGKAPGNLLAHKLAADGTEILSRPLCVYPQYPRYIGPAGDAAAERRASSFVCVAP
jgi:feruloyl esterase